MRNRQHIAHRLCASRALRSVPPYHIAEIAVDAHESADFVGEASDYQAVICREITGREKRVDGVGATAIRIAIVCIVQIRKHFAEGKKKLDL